MNTDAGDRNQTRRVRRWSWVVLALLLAWPMMGPVTGRGAHVPAEDAVPPLPIAEVVVRDNYFEPSALEVSPGTTVVWTWEGIAPHNVYGKEFESPVQTSGIFSLAFANPGTYDYVCTLHRGMHGRVLVADALD